MMYARFQSRNRESYLFKSTTDTDRRGGKALFQSRNRESYLFKHQGHYARLRRIQ